ncbi:(d)CMP kinase [Metabacillus sediminilitoris]|jgi:cytidylate kinase|uniref:Cytidylate kinase n=1 Tax=Metabacillus sediminilitoris TaxID=2567941 RepID=A0A4V3WG52_9BACI|nr:(d)CMP kinase [Metabacillus sediminilitoris]QGQ46713.1 (d)CMP kinase [Metabacillus sediminilitoris]THF82863.1 (d)CMP kinase [Metabacillus sediminilitoris]
MKQKLSIAIDGPAAAGKSTVAKIIAEHYSYIYIDTGAMYRALTYKALENNIDLHDEDKVADVLSTINIELLPTEEGQNVMVNEENVTEIIRSNEVTNNVSIVAMHSKVREEMLKRQRQLAREGGVVMDGRDIGTHVLPNAELKIFLRASVEERAKRRHEENQKKGFSSNLEQLKQEIANRDKLDSEREVAPLRKADDAIEIDTTALSILDVVNKIENYIEERL